MINDTLVGALVHDESTLPISKFQLNVYILL